MDSPLYSPPQKHIADLRRELARSRSWLTSQICPQDAALLEVADGDGLSIGADTLEVRLNTSMPAGCVGYAVGHSGTANLQAGQSVTLARADSWQRRRPQLIGSDAGAYPDTSAGGAHD